MGLVQTLPHLPQLLTELWGKIWHSDHMLRLAELTQLLAVILLLLLCWPPLLLLACWLACLGSRLSACKATTTGCCCG
jgi:hypothetical protein